MVDIVLYHLTGNLVCRHRAQVDSFGHLGSIVAIVQAAYSREDDSDDEAGDESEAKEKEQRRQKSLKQDETCIACFGVLEGARRKKAAISGRKKKRARGKFLGFVGSSTRTAGSHGGVTHRTCRWVKEIEVAAAHELLHGSYLLPSTSIL